MAHVANGGYEMVGTFNGNPLAMAAARAMLTEVATPEAYASIDALRTRAVDRYRGRDHRDHGLAAHVVSAGAKGCVVFRPEPVRDYRGFLDDRRPVQPRALALSSTTAGSSCRRGARSSSG